MPGYIAQAEPIAVELDKTDVDLEDIANGQTVVRISKVDAETAEELPGAVLELYAPGRIAVGYLGNQRHSPCHPRPACG